MSAQIHAIAVPKWGIEMVEGTLNSWSKELGDHIDAWRGDSRARIRQDRQYA